MATKNEIIALATDEEVATVAKEQQCSEGFVRAWMQGLDLSKLKWDYKSVSADEAVSYFLHEVEFTLAESLGEADFQGDQHVDT